MNKNVYISELAHDETKKYIINLGYKLNVISQDTYNSDVSISISYHPDIYMCKLGIDNDDKIFIGVPEFLGEIYPNDAIYNGCTTKDFFIHKLSITSPDLLSEIKNSGKTLVNVPQGYTRCNCLPISENAIITSDKGIYKNTKDLLDVLLISSGNVELPGYEYGFIGGTAGRVENKIIFNGDLSFHPDYEKIKSFIEGYGLEPVFFSGLPLVDIGSILV